MSVQEENHSRQGKYQGKFNNSSTNKKEHQEKKSSNELMYYIGSARQASDYEALTEYLINYIQQNFEFGDDIANAIVNQEPINTDLWKPILQKSNNSDPEIKELETEQYKMEFQADYEHYRLQKRTYINNLTKAYALFWSKCTKGMKNKIESRSNFKSNIKLNPFELLKVIKEHSLNYHENQYNMSLIFEAQTSLFTTKQKEGESLQDYTKRFYIAREVYETLIGGPIKLSNFTWKPRVH